MRYHFAVARLRCALAFGVGILSLFTAFVLLGAEAGHQNLFDAVCFIDAPRTYTVETCTPTPLRLALAVTTFVVGILALAVALLAWVRSPRRRRTRY